MKLKITPRVTGFEIPLLKREPSQCAYIVGHQLMCGAPTMVRFNRRTGDLTVTSWCPYHYQKVFKEKG